MTPTAQPPPVSIYLIEEVSDSHSPYLPSMVHWLNQIFPEYTPRFESLVANKHHPDGRHEAQIFIIPDGDQVIGLVQIFYRQWQGGLIADIDLLGVLEAYRRRGLGTVLVMCAFQATREVSSAYGLPAIGVTTLIDPNLPPIVQLHQNMGGQRRRDLKYLGGDVIVWYPFQDNYTKIATKDLAWQVWQFGGLPPAEFTEHFLDNL